MHLVTTVDPVPAGLRYPGRLAMATNAAPLMVSGGRASNLPVQNTSFVGREEQIDDVKRLLAMNRLLSLTGAGGCGKTRLALRVGADVVESYPGGVWLIELAPLSDAALVIQAVADTLGVREHAGGAMTDRVEGYLRERDCLLILDNCEHVIDGAAQVAETLLRGCPGVRVLATSREPLRAAGETTWRVPSLSVPPSAAWTSGTQLDDVLQFESVRLFVDRAQAALPAFELTPDNAAAVQEVCRRLDGIPLAIELAAARVRAFAVEQIAARLDDRFRLLTTGSRTAMPRQQTLRATVDWSDALLSEPERALLRRLSVFAGGWTLEAAEAVAIGGGIQMHAVPELLAILVDKSLVVADHQRGAVRYRLLETIRQYARERLEEVDEADRTRDRHLAFCVGLAEEAEPKLRGPEARMVMQRLDDEHDNLRAALDWALGTDAESAQRLSGALGWFWWARDTHTEGRRWLARALAASPTRTSARMKALHAAGWLAHHQRDTAEARVLLEESLAIARELGDRWMAAWAFQGLGRVAYFENDPATAGRLAEESLALGEALADQWLVAWALHLRGLAAYLAQDYLKARDYYQRSLAIRRDLGYEEGIGVLCGLLGLVAIRERDLGEARRLFLEALAIMHGLLEPWQIAMLLACLGYIAADQGQPSRAVRLGAVAMRLSESNQTPLIPLMEPLLTEGLELAKSALGEAAFAQAWQHAGAMSVEQAVAEAAAVEVVSTPTSTTLQGVRGGPFGDFTATELRVLRLLASGRTTKEIAAELVVAVSTVDRHITHIYDKLGVRNRAEATALAHRHGLAERTG
jgi:non-specific serine/threonine protein kinase